MVAVQMYIVETLLGPTIVVAIRQALCIETENVMVSHFIFCALTSSIENNS